MGWTLPRDWMVGEVITEAMMDTHVKDNFRYLKGIDGVVTIQSGLIIDNSLGTEYLKIPSLTTAQRDAIASPAAGMLIYNSTTTQFNKYENGVWRADLGFNSAHSGLSGLTDGDDHPQYPLKTILTTRGDIIYRDATTWARLPKGTAGYYLTMGANDPAWTAPPAVPSGGIIMWAGTIANIPGGYVICDGNNLTPNLLARFVEGVATAATNPGATGGATSKTTAGHQHQLPISFNGYFAIGNVYGLGAAQSTTHTVTRTASAQNVTSLLSQSKTDSISDIRPLFYDLAFLLKT